MIEPDDFIPIAEETGLIVPVGQWVLRLACQHLKEWSKLGADNIRIAVNVSSHQFQSDSLVDDVLGAAADAGIEPRFLELEITESVLLQDAECILAALMAFKEAGITLSVDDFGTGYSSLRYLKRFPIDTLKIDQSFVEFLATDPDDATICAAILAMAQQLGLNVVAEGVETKEQLEFLRLHKCDQIQGFLCSKPLPPTKFMMFMNKATADAASGKKAIA